MPDLVDRGEGMLQTRRNRYIDTFNLTRFRREHGGTWNVLVYHRKTNKQCRGLSFTRYSVPDPFHFEMETVPDPWICTLTLDYGSGSCSISQWLSWCQQKICFFKGFLLISTFWGYNLNQSSKITCHKTVEINIFRKFFCLLMEGSGSRSWRPKNVRIMRIRIQNTARYCMVYFLQIQPKTSYQAHLSSSPMSTESSNSSTTLFAPNPKINNSDIKTSMDVRWFTQ